MARNYDVENIVQFNFCSRLLELKIKKIEHFEVISPFCSHLTLSIAASSVNGSWSPTVKSSSRHETLVDLPLLLLPPLIECLLISQWSIWICVPHDLKTLTFEVNFVKYPATNDRNFDAEFFLSYFAWRRTPTLNILSILQVRLLKLLRIDTFFRRTNSEIERDDL